MQRSLIAALLAVGAIGAAIYAPLTIGNAAPSQFSDALTYLFMADFFSPWRECTSFAYAAYASARFPPLYPALLGLLGAGSDRLPSAHLIQGALVVAGALLGALYARLQCRSNLAALAIGIACLLSPLTLRIGLELGSEPVFVVLMLGTLIALECCDAQGADRRDALPGLLAGLAVLSREVGALLLPVVLLWAIRRRSRWGAAGVVLALAAWAGWHALRVGYAENVSYGAQLAHFYGGASVTGALARATGQFRTFVTAGWIEGSLWSIAMPAILAVAALGVCALPAFVRGLRRAEPLALFVLLYLALMAAWPFPGHVKRFAAPLLVPIAVLSWRSIASLARSPEAARVLAATIVLAPALTQAPRLVERLALPLPDATAPYRGHAEWFEASDDATALLGADARKKTAAVVAAIRRWPDSGTRFCALMSDAVMQGAQRPVTRIPPLWEQPIDYGWLKERCDFLYLTDLGVPSQRIQPFYPAELLPQPIRPVVAAVIDRPGEPLLIASIVAVNGYDREPEIIR